MQLRPPDGDGPAPLAVAQADAAPPSTGPEPAARQRWRVAVVAIALVLAFVVGGAIRLIVFTGDQGEINADEAIVGLMAEDVLDGRWRSFYWGQEYGGTLETIPLAPFVWAFEERLELQVLPLLETLAVVALTFAVARRILDRDGALLAAALAWIYPLSAVYFSTRQMLFYLPVTICGLLVMWSALVVAEDPRRRRWWFLAGLAVGLGWWSSAQIILFAIPVAAWLACRLRLEVRLGWPAAVGAVLGAAPWIRHQIVYPEASLLAQPVGGESTYLDRLEIFATDSLPLQLGLKHMGYLTWVVPQGRLVVLAVVALVALAFLRPIRRRSVHLWVLAAFPFLMALSSSATYVGLGRYLFFLTPVVAITLMHAARGLFPRLLVLVVAAVLTVSAVDEMTGWGYPTFSNAGPTDDLRATLAEEGFDRAVAGYWTAYKLFYESDREVLVAPTTADRSPEMTAEVWSSDQIVYVYVTVFEGWAERVAGAREALDALGIRSKQILVDGYVVLVPEGPVTPGDLPPELLPA